MTPKALAPTIEKMLALVDAGDVDGFVIVAKHRNTGPHKFEASVIVDGIDPLDALVSLTMAQAELVRERDNA